MAIKNSSLYLRQLEVGPMENFIYLIGDKTTRECIMVDPAWDVPQVLSAAEADGMKVTAGLVTHTHFDHVNGAAVLLEKTGGKLYVHKNEAEFLKGMKTHIEKVESGHKLRIGGIEITFIHTPGHTPGSQCFLVKDAAAAQTEAERLVSGDTLFINACGRCDLPGGNAKEMYESLQRLAKLDESVILLPGHNYADDPTSTIGKEKRENPYYQAHSMQEFMGARLGY